jgi:GntR family transcriptional regulator, transcriptional repressor for pyruvate dehydrogenase complex
MKMVENESSNMKSGAFDDASLTIVARIVNFVRSAGYSAGDRIPAERNLAEQFGVSRNSVRESLIALEALRFVERRPNSGAYLSHQNCHSSVDAMSYLAASGIAIETSDLIQSIEVRHTLEMLSIRLAAQRCDADNRATLRASLEQSAAEIERGGSMDSLDRDFHLAIAAAGRNDVLVRTLNALYLMAGERRELYFADVSQARSSLEQHRAIVAALDRGDANGAIAAMEAHLESSEHFFEPMIA